MCILYARTLLLVYSYKLYVQCVYVCMYIHIWCMLVSVRIRAQTNSDFSIQIFFCFSNEYSEYSFNETKWYNDTIL